MKYYWKIVTNKQTQQKYYYHKQKKIVFPIYTIPQKKYNFPVKYFNTLDKNDLTPDIIKILTKHCSKAIIISV